MWYLRLLGKILLGKSVGVSPADEDMSLEEHEAIVVGAIGTGAPRFLTGWSEGTKVEFMIVTEYDVGV